MKYDTDSLKKIDFLKNEIDKLLPISDENKKKLAKKLRLEFNYNSNHLEGNTLTYGQTELLLLYDKVSGNVKLSDVEEMKAHDIALSMIEDIAKDKERPLTEAFIKELNKLILVRPFWKEAITSDGTPTRKKIEIGRYKSMPNRVRLRSGEIHEYASPEETPAKMNELIEWYRHNENLMHPVQLAIEFHYKFVCIHPFDDGNGRVARLIMNYILLKNSFPPIIIKSNDKSNYLTALQKADVGDIISMIEYHEEQLLWALDLKFKAAKGEEIEEEGDIEKEIELLKRKKLTITKIHKTPKVSYELITHFNNKVWDSLSTSLAKFDDFFAETKNDIYVDSVKVEKKILKRNPFTVLTDRIEVLKSYEVFGYDLEETDINKIVWEKKFLSLKSENHKIDYFFNCNLELSESSYQLTLTELNSEGNLRLKNENIIFQKQYEYKDFPITGDINKLSIITSKHFIEIIRQK